MRNRALPVSDNAASIPYLFESLRSETVYTFSAPLKAKLAFIFLPIVSLFEKQKIATHSVNRIFSLLCLFEALVFPILLSRTESWFILRQFLVIAFLLLFVVKDYNLNYMYSGMCFSNVEKPLQIGQLPSI